MSHFVLSKIAILNLACQSTKTNNLKLNARKPSKKLKISSTKHIIFQVVSTFKLGLKQAS